MTLITDNDKYKVCSSCGANSRLTAYYKSFSPLDKFDERMKVCKKCLKNDINVENIESVKNVLRMVDRPFNINLWESALNKQDVVGEYFKLLNTKDFRLQNWSDSVFENKILENENDFSNLDGKNNKYLIELKDLYGHGYPDEEYYLFEKKYKQLKTSFQLPTAMHEEYLRDFCINKVKESIAKSIGDVKAAKEWAALAKESADSGKLKPSQMSKSDLSQGLDGFGQLSRMVEQVQDVIPLLPKFTSRPKDSVDVTLWLYVNYIRDIQGLPEAKYEELYDFYKDRVKDYESNMYDKSTENGDSDE